MSNDKLIPPAILFPESPQEPHETVMKAISETSGYIAKIRSLAKDRKKWLYKLTEETEEEVRTFFDKDQSTPTYTGTNSIGKRMVAVWNGEGEPDSNPDFY